MTCPSLQFTPAQSHGVSAVNQLDFSSNRCLLCRGTGHQGFAFAGGRLDTKVQSKEASLVTVGLGVSIGTGDADVRGPGVADASPGADTDCAVTEGDGLSDSRPRRQILALYILVVNLYPG